MFSDESKFMLYKHDGRHRVYRRPGERFKQACIEEKVAYGGGSVLVWAGISSESRTELVIIENGSLTSVRYVEEILNDHVGPFMVNLGEDAIFMHDNARPHTGRIVNDYLQEMNITRMEWPARSPREIQITPEDGLPQHICRKCLQKLNDCVEFIQLCENNDMKLRSLWIQHCDDGKLKLEDEKTILENSEFTFDTENTLSPKSETEVLQIDESVDHSIQSLLPDSLLGDVTKLETVSDLSMKSNLKKNIKQQCFTCGKVMSSRFRLKTHLMTHTGERPFSCPQCGKNFSLAQNLKVHLRVHTGEKPLHCTICGESFAHSAALATHKRKHTGQMPYLCLLCPRSFRTVVHLQYHTRRHTGEKNFECDTCGRAFITRSDLKRHLLTHTGDRPHVCCICGLRLTRASHLKRHIQLIHNGKSFPCPSCPVKFHKKTDLEKHLKNHAEKKDVSESN